MENGKITALNVRRVGGLDENGDVPFVATFRYRGRKGQADFSYPPEFVDSLDHDGIVSVVREELLEWARENF